MSTIVITTVPITEPQENVFKMCTNDPTLVRHISDWWHMSGKGEIVYQQDNIIMGIDGYFCAFYEKDLRMAIN